MIDRVQSWLDLHPHVRHSARIAGASFALLLYVAVIAAGFGVLGAVAAGVIIFVVNMAGPIDISSISANAVWGGWTSFVAVGAILGAVAGIIRTVMRVLRDDPHEHRSRAVLTRDLVAQAVVATRIGGEHVDLHLGVIGGGSMGWHYPVAYIGGTSDADPSYDRLTVQLANPSLAAADLPWHQRQEWFEEISRTADEIVINGVAQGAVEDDPAELIRGAARRARKILDETDDQVQTAIEAELRAAGHIRSARLQALLGPAASDLEALSIGFTR
jgi:hypothetical protein